MLTIIERDLTARKFTLNLMEVFDCKSKVLICTRCKKVQCLSTCIDMTIYEHRQLYPY